MTGQIKMMLGFDLWNSTISGWFGVWWLSIFVGMLDPTTFSYRGIIGSVLGILSMGVLIHTRKETPSLRMVYTATVVASCSLIGLAHSYDVFVLVAAIISPVNNTIMGAFHNSLKAQNVPKEWRHKYDNRSSLVDSCGTILGSTLALLTVFETVQPWIIWAAMYILMDLDIVVIGILVKLKVLTYERAEQ